MMRYCEQCGVENDEVARFCESCGAKLSHSTSCRYRIVACCHAALEVGREEFSEGQDYEEYLRAICNDDAEPEDLHEHTGVRPDVSCSSIVITDAEGRSVLECGLNPSSVESGFICFQSDGCFFDESDVNERVFLYQQAKWQEQTWACELELEAPFDARLLNVRYKAFKDGAGVLHKVVSGIEYNGDVLEFDWEGGDGVVESNCWVLEGGTRRAIDLCDFEDDEEDIEEAEDDKSDDEEEDVENAFFEDDVEDGDGGLDDKDLDPTRGYYMTIDGRDATLRVDSGQIIRRFHMSANVIQATTSGQTVTILTDDGYTTLYYWTGQIIRRTKR